MVTMRWLDCQSSCFFHGAEHPVASSLLHTSQSLKMRGLQDRARDRAQLLFMNYYIFASGTDTRPDRAKFDEREHLFSGSSAKRRANYY